MVLPIYAINLDSDRARWSSLAASIEQHAAAFPLHRVAAVDGRTIDQDEWRDVDFDLFEQWNGRSILPGEYGCYRSHLDALGQFLADGEPFGLIVEDDVLFDQESAARISAVLEAASDFDVVRLMSHRSKLFLTLRTSSAGDHIGRAAQGPQGSAAAYIVSRAGAQKLLASISTIRLPYDVALEQFWQHGAQVLSADRNVLAFSQHRQESRISPDGYDSQKLAMSKRLGAARARVAQHLARAHHVLLRPRNTTGHDAVIATHGLPAAILPDTRPRLAARTELLVALALLVFVSAVWVESDAYRYAGALLVLFAAAWYFPKGFWLYGKPLLGLAGIACIAWGGYVIGRMAFGLAINPEYGLGSSEGIYILPLLYATTGHTLFFFVRRPFVIAAAFIALSLPFLLLGINPAEEPEFGVLAILHNNPIHAAVAAGLIAMCALPFAIHALKRDDLGSAQRIGWSALGLLVYLVALLAVLYFSSKGVWLATAVALPVIVLIIFLTDKGRTARLISLLAVLMALGVAVIGQSDIVRIGGDTVSVAGELVSGALSEEGAGEAIDRVVDDPQTPLSARERIILWKGALDLWAKRPVFGHGASWLHHWQQRPDQEVDYNVFHNGFLEVAVRYGAFGLLLLALLAGWTVMRAWQAFRAGLVSSEAFQCHVATMTFFIVTILTNSNNRLAIGESYMWMAAAFGFYCSFILQRNGRVVPRTYV